MAGVAQIVRKRKYAPRKTQKIDFPKALSLRSKNQLSIDQIASYFGCTPQAVSARLSTMTKYLGTLEDLNKMREAKKDLLDSAFFINLCSLIDPDKVKKVSINNSV